MKKIAAIVVSIFALVGLTSNLLVSKYPWYCQKADGTSSFPILQDQCHRLGLRSTPPEELDWSTCSRVLPAPIPIAVGENIDLSARFLPPGTVEKETGKKHLLGTDRLGRDVAAALITGCRTSLLIALLAMSLALLIGGLIGGTAGFFGNALRVSIPATLFSIAMMSYGIFLLMHGSVGWVPFSLAILGLFIPAQKKSKIPWESMVMRTIEIFDSVPLLLLLLAISAVVMQPSYAGIALLIGLLSWPRYARYMRAEVLRLRKIEYVEAAKISGEKDHQVFIHYILPQVVPVMLVLFTYGLGSTILLESTLSFLGIGLPIDRMTWGTLLAQSRLNFNAWWLAVFPGMCIFFLVLSLNHLAESRQQRL
ncbi:MAG: ABC transporter permease [Saprospiraceae bacterium]|nr:ABC transporter permease [Saprospiraceae bacterium]